MYLVRVNRLRTEIKAEIRKSYKDFIRFSEQDILNTTLVNCGHLSPQRRIHQTYREE